MIIVTHVISVFSCALSPLCTTFMYIFKQPCVFVPSTTLAWHHIDKASGAFRELCWHKAHFYFILLVSPAHLPFPPPPISSLCSPYHPSLFLLAALFLYSSSLPPVKSLKKSCSGYYCLIVMPECSNVRCCQQRWNVFRYIYPSAALK